MTAIGQWWNTIIWANPCIAAQQREGTALATGPVSDVQRLYGGAGTRAVGCHGLWR
jgi:hypothetical protein